MDKTETIVQLKKLLARNFLIKMIDNKTEIEVSYHAKRTVTSGTQIGLSFEQISNMVKGAVGVDGNTLGFGMTFLHELHHTTIGGDYHDSTELFGTGPVVDNMNIIRNELNKQGFNYGERLNYKAIHTKEGNIIPFNESALTSLKYNSSMGKRLIILKQNENHYENILFDVHFGGFFDDSSSEYHLW